MADRSCDPTYVSSTPEHTQHSASGVNVDISGLSITPVPASRVNRPQTYSNRLIANVTCLPDTPERLEYLRDGVNVDFCGLREDQLPYRTPRNPDTHTDFTGRDVACLPVTPLQLHNTGPSLASHTPDNCTLLDVTYSPNSPVQLHNIQLPTTPYIPTYSIPSVANSPATPEQLHDMPITTSRYGNEDQYVGGHNTAEASPNVKAEDYGKVSTTMLIPDVQYDDGTNIGGREALKHCGSKELVSEGTQTEYHPLIVYDTSTSTYPLVQLSKQDGITTELNSGSIAGGPIAEKLTFPQNTTNDVPKEADNVNLASVTPDLVPASNTRPSGTTFPTTTTATGPGTTPKKRCSGRPTPL